MIRVTRTVPFSPPGAAAPRHVPKRALFFDIETTGLSRASSVLYLIGAIWPGSSGWEVRQWLAERPEEEPELLTSFLELASGFDCLIHFNGTTFDLPFLAGKCQKYHIKNSLTGRDSLDLYQSFRPLKRLLGLEHMNQTSLQAFLGQKRADKLDGKALIPVYRSYVSKAAPELSEPLLLHNFEDLCGMTQLLPLFSYLELLQGDIQMKSCRISDASGENRSARFSFQINTVLPQPICCRIGESYLLQAAGQKGSIQVPLLHGELLYFFPNYREYYYLPLEDQAVHRSVATFVDQAHRQPARPSNCYIRKEGDFLLQPEEYITPAFRISYDSRQLYCEYDPAWEQSPGILLEYVRGILRRYDTERAKKRKAEK